MDQQDRVQTIGIVIKAGFSSWNQATKSLVIQVQFIQQKKFMSVLNIRSEKLKRYDKTDLLRRLVFKNRICPRV